MKALIFPLLALLGFGGMVGFDQSAPKPITEITLERTPCFGHCPSYVVKVTSDGDVDYEGRVFAPRQGHFSAKIAAKEFKALADKAKAIGFFGLEDRYDRLATDLPSAITTVVQGDKKKRIADYGRSGPESLQRFVKMIDEVVNKATDWKAEPKKGDAETR